MTDRAITLQSQIEQHVKVSPAAAYLASLPSESSRRTQQDCLRNIVAIVFDKPVTDIPVGFEFQMPFHIMTAAHTNAIRSALIQKYKAPTVNKHLSALRGVLKECWRMELMDIEAYNRAVDFKNVKNESLPAGREVPDAELRKLLISCYEDGAKGVRDLAILAVLITTGIRREELVKLDIDDYDAETGALKVFGKGRKERIVYAVNKTKTLLDNWIAVRGNQPGALFPSMRRGGNLTMNRMPTEGIYKMLQERSERVGIAPVAPHNLRRTFVGNLLDAGVDIVIVSKLTGHANVSTTQRYDRRPERAKKDAAGKIDLPI